MATSRVEATYYYTYQRKMSLNPVEPRKVKSKHLPLINVCNRGEEAGVKYIKPALSFEQQADLLLDRGLHADRARLIETLSWGTLFTTHAETARESAKRRRSRHQMPEVRARIQVGLGLA